MSTRQLNTRIDTGLKTRVVAAVAAIKNRRPDYTLRAACEEALGAWVSHVENRDNDGLPFRPPATGDLPAGRPPQTASTEAP